MDQKTQLRRRVLTWGFFSGVTGFLVIVALKYAGALDRIDEVVLVALRAVDDRTAPIGPSFLEQAVVQFTALGGYTVMGVVVIVATGALILSQHRRLAAILPTAFLSAIALENLLKSIFARPRPDIVGHLVETHSMSFPSGHAMVGAVMWLTLGAIVAHLAHRSALRRYALVVALAMAFLLGLSRLYLGVHWPSDILAGWALGVAWAALILLAMPRFRAG
ncbi:phosphatase PAP2 family protein [Aliihoeflea aestuarii]|jgi:undecaprenyl-diphosphatase|uniref:phosphatase PAP2 family protein n=1 Tax=Aliihoeflea aestuarii TaxID=453840 RepID=UPI0020951AAE|nr:phosphatase PAP2 family protein [Aliihoeflea aestuarii]MCO6392816.1 phosphatase PAP2 family protein [Aliihoeflea aestuarii]